MDEMMDTIEKLCREEGKHYLYSYWPEPDHTMHNMGTTCREVKALANAISGEVERLSKKLKDTLIIVTADHGHIDSKNRYIGDYPDILKTLKRLPSIEPRTLAFFVKEGMEEEFKRAFLKHFGDAFILLSKQEVIEKGVFGGSELHTHFEGFIGDYLAMAIDDTAIFNSLSWYESFKGVHAGLTEKEMKVPLIIIECP
jgi:predicted AlkP superfamily pyrophosphatase or phosphodiesterase